MIRHRVIPHPIGLLAAVLAAVAPFGCARRPVASATNVLAVPGRANAHVTLASENARVAVVWAAIGARGTDIFLAMSDDRGAHVGAPLRVNDIDGDATANGERASTAHAVPTPPIRNW